MACELLKGLRMLDLTDDKGALCGKIFADLGAEVIKVEPPTGCSTRRIPPFLDGRPEPDSSLYFLALQAGKRSITLNLESIDGRRMLTELAERADFLVESYPLGYLESIGLGYEALSARNPRLIYTSILPFGDRGPGKDYRAADINLWAAGGMMYLMGEEGKPPLQISAPQAGLHAGAEASTASLIAHFPRRKSGLGQHVVIDMQACIVGTMMNEQAMPIMHGASLGRSGVFVGSAKLRRKAVFRCADGHISLVFAAGPIAASSRALIEWMDEKGFATDWMKKKNLATWAPGMVGKVTDQDLQEVAELDDSIERFLMTMTKREIHAEGLKRRILLSPVLSIAEIAADEQLAAREFFVTVADAYARGGSLTLLGAVAKLSLTPMRPTLRAPGLGEHNHEIYAGLLGLDSNQIAMLRATQAI